MDFFSHKSVFILGLAAYIIIFFAFFPKIYSSIDEHTFLKNAILLKSGKIAEPDPELACRSAALSANGYIGGQFIGRSLFILPFSYFGLDAVMLSGLIVHLLNAALIYLILRRLSADPRLALLYLFFPAMLWESRTLYSEIFVLTFFLSGFYFYIRGSGLSKGEAGFSDGNLKINRPSTHRSNFWHPSSVDKFSDCLSGAFFGLAAFVRYDALIGAIAFAIPLAISERRRLAKFAAGFAPAFALLLAFNTLAYGGPMNSGYGSGLSLAASIVQTFSPLWAINFLTYAAILLIVFPGMLASPYFMHRRIFPLQFALLSLGYLAMNSRFTNFFAFDFSIQNLFTARLRYLVPLIGLLLIPYSASIDSAISRLKISKGHIFIAAIGMLSAGAIFASAQHAAFLGSRYATYGQIDSAVPSGALIVGSSDDCMYSMSKNLERKRYLNVSPKNDLGQNSPVTLAPRINDSTYFLDIRYSGSELKTGLRQGTVAAERKLMSDFLESNKTRLELVFESNQPNSLKVYKWRGG